MELTIEQLRSVTFGATEILSLEDGYHFRRFSERQIDVLFHDNEKPGRNYDTTGIRLDFTTDAACVQVDTACRGKYEILVNDLTVAWECTEGPARLEATLSGNGDRVTIMLPSHSEGILQRIRLEKANYITPYPHKYKLAFYGDSITQGWNSEKDSQSFAWQLTRFLDADCMNFGVGGTTFIPELPERIDYAADAVLVAMGTNDFGRGKTMDQIRSDSRAYLRKITQIYPNSKHIYISPVWRLIGLQVRTAGTLDQVRKELAEIAKESGFTVIDGLSMIPPRLEYYADNGTHPNDLGFSMYALHLIKALENIL